MTHKRSENRRGFLKTLGVGTGAAVAGATGGALMTTAAREAEAQARPTKLDQIYQQFGKNVFIVPGKFTGTVAALDLYTGKTLAWTAFWNYGDDNPIIHHMAAFPAPEALGHARRFL